MAAAEQAVTRADGVVLDMAYFTAREDKPAELLPPAGRAGRCVRGDHRVPVRARRSGTSRGLSYTELEFAAAGELGLPRLVFVLDENAVLPLPGVFLADPVHGERQRAFRDRVQDAGITVQLGGVPAELELGLFQALTELRAAERPGRRERTATGRRGWRCGWRRGRCTWRAGRSCWPGWMPGWRPGGAGRGWWCCAGWGVRARPAWRWSTRTGRLGGLGVVWQLPAEDPAGLAAGFAELAAHLGAGDGGGDPVGRVHAVLARAG